MWETLNLSTNADRRTDTIYLFIFLRSNKKQIVGGPKIILSNITFSGEYSVCLYIRHRQHNPSGFLSGVEWILLLKNHITKF